MIKHLTAKWWKGGQMVCPGCGKSHYTVLLCGKVACVCGRVWEYSELLFSKKVSQKGWERRRRE